jgi:hypothetical protein
MDPKNSDFENSPIPINVVLQVSAKNKDFKDLWNYLRANF